MKLIAISLLAVGLNGQKVEYERGLASSHQGHYSEAIEDFNRSLALKPDFVEALMERGFAYGQLFQYQRGIEDFDQALVLAPKNTEALLLRAAARRRQDQALEAVEDYTQAIRYRPADPWLYLMRGACYAELGSHEKALDDRTEALRRDPKLAEAYVARGGSYHQLGRHKEGLADRTEAIRLAPQMAEAWCARGNAYYLLADYRNSAADLKEALRLQPVYPEASDVLLKAQSKLVSAVAVAPLRTIAPAPENSYERGRQMIQGGQFREAIPALSQSISLKPQFAPAYNARGYAYLRIRDYPHAMADFDKAILLDPQYVNAHHNRDVCRKAAVVRQPPAPVNSARVRSASSFLRP